MKVVTILGTRPEIIRLARVIDALDRSIDHVLVHTGQNYDHGLNGIFFEELELRAPDHYLAVDTGSLGRVLGETLIRTEAVLREERPDAVLILGDTNSSIAAVIARRMHIPVFHMEAGNRCFDGNVPEEANRRLVDHTADYNLVYTEHARRNLLSEGISPQRVVLTGSPLREVLDHYAPGIAASEVLDAVGVSAGGYFLVSAHREENVDEAERLSSLLAALDELARSYELPVLVSTHPRTRKRIDSLGWQADPRVRFHEPFGFFDYVRLQQLARCVLSDSGTISEESAMLGFPAVTLRDAIERPESVDAGGILLTGVREDAVLAGVRLVLEEWDAGVRAQSPPEYTVANTSSIVVRTILSMAPTHHRRNALRVRGLTSEAPGVTCAPGLSGPA